jgi:hypothetical protein
LRTSDAATTSARRRFHGSLCEMQLNIPKLSLIIGCISLGVSLIALYFVIANYNINTRADRPLVRTTGAHLSRTGDTYTLQVSFMNVGKEDAAGVTLKAGTLNSTTMAPKLLGTENITRLRAALWTASQHHSKIFPKTIFVSSLLFASCMAKITSLLNLISRSSTFTISIMICRLRVRRPRNRKH